MFESLRQTESNPVPRLHTLYQRLSNGKSKVADIRLLVERGFSESCVEKVFNLLSLRNSGNMPTTGFIVKNFSQLLAEAEEDPVASKLPITQEAIDLAERICADGECIDIEYVQDALNRYRAYLGSNSHEFFWYLLPPAQEFVYSWYVEMAKWGSPRNRRFSVSHLKFEEFLRLVRRAANRG